jgi:hypothetical protein
MKKLFLLLLAVALLSSCEKETSQIDCEHKFIEMYNLRSGGVARQLIPYNCEVSEQQNLSCYDCMQPNTGCRIVFR